MEAEQDDASATPTERRSRNGVAAVGVQVATNLRRIRESQGLTTAKLAERLAELGRPIVPTGITKIENKDRQVNVDDLLALAWALGVPPVSLLLPPEAEAEYRVTPTVSSTAVRAYRWLIGTKPPPLDPAADQHPGEGGSMIGRYLGGLAGYMSQPHELDDRVRAELEQHQQQLSELSALVSQLMHGERPGRQEASDDG
jgi:transcriptional regulator with XRE-family HTH domain